MPADFRSADQPWMREFVKRAELFERLEGGTIARAEHCEGERNPLGGAMYGLEFEDGQRLLLMAIPDFSEGSQAPWKLAAAFVADDHMIWSPSVTKHFTRSRAAAGEMAPGWFQVAVEGQAVDHARLLPELTEWGGEQVMVLLRSGDAFLTRACPPLKHGRWRYTANFHITFIPKHRSVVG